MGNWQAKVMSAVVVLLAVALAGRASYELLRPLVPVLAVIVTLGVIYALLFGRGWR